MLQNITLSAEKSPIERARKRAAAENTTLNVEFRRWLEQYVERPASIEDLETFMARFQYSKPGKKYSRDALNER
jgi:hypothetical protein